MADEEEDVWEHVGEEMTAKDAEGAGEEDQGTYLHASELEALCSVPSSYGSKVTQSALERISRAAGAHVAVDSSRKVSITSDVPAREERARKYLRLCRTAKQGWVEISDSEDNGDLSFLEVPENAYGSNPKNDKSDKLAIISEESSSLLFFVHVAGSGAAWHASKSSTAEWPPVEVKPSAPLVAPTPTVPWLAKGKKVQVKRPGNFGSNTWQQGTVGEVLRHGNVMIRLDEGNHDQFASQASTRPLFAAEEVVEYHDGNGEWKEVIFSKFLDGDDESRATILIGQDKVQVEVEPANLRPLGCRAEEPVPAPEAAEEAAVESEAKVEEEATEKEWEKEKESTMRIAIFGELTGRCEAAMRLMSMVSQRRVDFFMQGETVDISSFDFGVAEGLDWKAETHELGQEFLAQVIGSKGSMRKKLKAATGCLLEYVGTTAIICGPAEQRTFCKALLETFRTVRRSTVPAPLPQGILEYADILELPEETVGFVNGKSRMMLSKVEEDEGVLCLFEQTDEQLKKAEEKKKQDESWTWTEELGWQEVLALAKDGEASSEQAPEVAPADEEGKSDEAAKDGEASSEQAPEVALADEEGKTDEAAKADEAPPTDTPDESKPDDAKADDAKAEVPAEEAYEWVAPPPRKIIFVAWSTRSRKRAALRVGATVEAFPQQKYKGHFSQHYAVGIDESDRLAIDVVEIAAEEMKFACGKKMQNRLTVEAAAGCAMEFLGEKATLVGTGAERARGRQYIQWLLAQHVQSDGQAVQSGERSLCLSPTMLEARTDLTTIQVSTAEKKLLDGDTLRSIEQSTSTFIFFREVPVHELLAAGAHIVVKRGGREFYLEVTQADEHQENGINVSLRPSDVSAEDVENQAIVPVLIFGHNDDPSGYGGRALAAQKIRDHLEAAGKEDEQDDWNAQSCQETADAKYEQPSHSSQWDGRGGVGGGDSWSQPRSGGAAEEKPWDRSAGQAAEGGSWGKDDGYHKASADSSWQSHSTSGGASRPATQWEEKIYADVFKSGNKWQETVDAFNPCGNSGNSGYSGNSGSSGNYYGGGGQDKHSSGRDKYDEHTRSEDKWGGGSQASKEDQPFKPGDWKCPSCGGHNFAKRSTCFSCEELSNEQSWGNDHHDSGNSGASWSHSAAKVETTAPSWGNWKGTDKTIPFSTGSGHRKW